YALLDEAILFSGDHVMGWSTSVVSPPGGDMGAYLHSLERLLPRPDAVYLPTHEPMIRDPQPYVRALAAHRRDREAAIHGRPAPRLCVQPLASDRRHRGAACPGRRAAAATGVRDMVAALYVGLDPRLVKAAGRSVLAHLQLLVREGRAVADGAPTVASVFGPA